MIEKIVRNFFKKPNFKLSKDVPSSYVVKVGFEYLLGLARGTIRKIGFGSVGSRLILGNNVKFRVKSKINIGNNVKIGSKTIIDALSTEGVQIDDNVKIGEDSKIIVTGSVSNLGKRISIGKNSSFSDNTFFGAAGGIEIGSDVIAGQNVRFHAENHNFKDKDILIRLQGVNHQGIKVGDNVWIGAGAVFLDGARVGNGCVIAANSVVKGTFKPNSVIGGVPAKLIKSR